jgi:phosphohistidine swiveling domain-containing protein
MQNENEILWTAAFLNERFTSIVSPLGWSFVGSLFEQLALRDPLRYMGFPDAEKISAARLWHGHPYVNTEIFQVFYKPFPDMLVPADAVRYFPHGDLGYRKRASYPHSMFQPRFLMSLAYHLLRDPYVTSPLNFLAWRRFTPRHDAKILVLNRRLDHATNAQDVLGVIAGAYTLDTEFLHIHRWSLTYADLLYKMLAKWADGHAQELMSHVPNKTREVNAEIAALAQRSLPLSAELLQRIGSHGPMNDAEQKTADALAAFLDRHGHRAFSLDIAQPTFRDDPTQLLAFMPGAVVMSGPKLIRQKSARETRGHERVAWNPIVALAQRYAQLREDQRYFWQKSLAVTRRAYLLLGSDLAARELISGAPDIFFAVREEITAYYGMELAPEELAERIAARKSEWRRYIELDRTRGADAYPLFLRGDVPLPAHEQIEPQPKEWRGRGVSAGVARGIARIVHEPRELGRVGAGEILVAPSTDPAWTPVFGRLKGLVLERGGVLSHGAVVAREYHLPAVTAVTNLTHALQDGEWIEVDGTNGIVRRVAGAE